MNSMNFQPPHYNTNPAFCSFPVQPMLMPCQGFLSSGFLTSPAFSLQHSQNTKPLARKRTHICPVRSCGKHFTTSGNLSRHKRLHGTIDPLDCPIDGCICVFPSINKLERHLKFHYGGDVKVCHVEACGRTFSTTGNLNRHLKKHHGGVSTSSAVSVMTTPTQMSDNKVSAQRWNPCASSNSESGSESEESIESWWSSPSPLETSAASLDCVWNEDLLDTLAAILDNTVVIKQKPQAQVGRC